jgi:hypothetical protein
MINTVSKNDFIEWFKKSEQRNNQFTYEALNALFDHLEEYEEGTGEKIEFDPIAICCEFTEYENIKEYNKNYEPVKNLDAIRELTTVIETRTKGFIIQNY